MVFSQKPRSFIYRAKNYPVVLRELYTTLKSGELLFSSYRRFENQKVFRGVRYDYPHDLETYRNLVTLANFGEIHHYNRPQGL